METLHDADLYPLVIFKLTLPLSDPLRLFRSVSVKFIFIIVWAIRLTACFVRQGPEGVASGGAVRRVRPSGVHDAASAMRGYERQFQPRVYGGSERSNERRGV